MKQFSLLIAVASLNLASTQILATPLYMDGQSTIKVQCFTPETYDDTPPYATHYDRLDITVTEIGAEAAGENASYTIRPMTAQMSLSSIVDTYSGYDGDFSSTIYPNMSRTVIGKIYTVANTSSRMLEISPFSERGYAYSFQLRDWDQYANIPSSYQCNWGTSSVQSAPPPAPVVVSSTITQKCESIQGKMKTCSGPKTINQIRVQHQRSKVGLRLEHKFRN